MPELFPFKGVIFMQSKPTSLWTRDFTKITAATAVSIIGGEAMNLPVSLLVFDQTRSTFLSALVLVMGILPDALFSVLVAPFIDRGRKKRWIVGLDALFLLVYAFMAWWTGRHAFRVELYLMFTLVTATLSVFYRLAFDAWYPDLIPVGFEQQGFAVAGSLYNIITVIMAPVSAFLYERVSMSTIFAFVAATTAAAIILEVQITEVFHTGEHTFSLRSYLEDLKDGFLYMKKEHGIRNIFVYQSVSAGSWDGTSILRRAYFQTSPVLTVTMLGLLQSAEMITRSASGIVLYRHKVPRNKRFGFTKFVYTSISLLSGIMLFLPFPGMLACNAITGALGNTSYTIRETATMSYLPPQIRARVSAIFSMMTAISCVVMDLVVGAMGEVVPYRAGIIILCILELAIMVRFIWIPAADNRRIYEAERESQE